MSSVRLRALIVCVLPLGFCTVLELEAATSVARIWNERALAAIRVDTPHPPVQARNCFCIFVAMYDAWSVYDAVASATSIAPNTPLGMLSQPVAKRSAMCWERQLHRPRPFNHLRHAET